MTQIGIVDNNRPGLEMAFQAGEKIPLKGIYFEISKVEKAVLTLIPVGLTEKRRKMIQEERHGR